MISETKSSNCFSNDSHDTGPKYTYELVKDISDFVMKRIHIKPKVGIICGSGMGAIPEELTEKIEIEYKDIPHFPISTVQGHDGKLVTGKMGRVGVICMQGRFHYYEGYPLSTCSMPVRMMKLCGITHIIISNAAGGINPEYNIGDIMIIKDHINFLGYGGVNPLVGAHDERWGPRFVPVNKIYSEEVREKAKIAAQRLGIESFLREGVLSITGGPCYETVAESRMLHKLGADAVGMSVIGEAITACQAGLTVFGFSLIAGKCPMEYSVDSEISHSEVVECAQKREILIRKWVLELVGILIPSLPSDI
ncbi:purine nucleoside phosphorylase [Encephalitozoon romaleae SJ-2008]|uniref:Purine nucleoside phosphorylase n=2 Tax=Encephalitozoon romaleae TaxID=571949 RepID=I7ALB8_ENCRO|nr:purine nucleoside phosphorylase [Encephalitozoon romaleae SJ-2008]AEI16588.1 purine nucleoside phosphorylase [Encephalitozoon romaleae]AFN82454.1 purine nucleoside phosphorylase [Encephalitozoon romaleae SJ-2008]